EIILGQRAGKEAIEAVHRDLGIDRPVGEQYLNYLNDLSPVSVHDHRHPGDFWYLDPARYDWTPLFTLGSDKVVVLKYPYLRRSYITRRNVSGIIRETLPETTVLAITAMVI